jgi:hypothetical protein
VTTRDGEGRTEDGGWTIKSGMFKVGHKLSLSEYPLNYTTLVHHPSLKRATVRLFPPHPPVERDKEDSVRQQTAGRQDGKAGQCKHSDPRLICCLLAVSAVSAVVLHMLTVMMISATVLVVVHACPTAPGCGVGTRDSSRLQAAGCRLSERQRQSWRFAKTLHFWIFVNNRRPLHCHSLPFIHPGRGVIERILTHRLTYLVQIANIHINQRPLCLYVLVRDIGPRMHCSVQHMLLLL